MPMYWTFNSFLGYLYAVYYIVYIILNFDFRKKRTKLPELGSWGGGGLGDSGNARKKTFFFSLMSSLMLSSHDALPKCPFPTPFFISSDWLHRLPGLPLAPSTIWSSWAPNTSNVCWAPKISWAPIASKQEFWSNGSPGHFGSPAENDGFGSPGSLGAQNHEMY